jgi:hypothetical protein
MTDNEKKEIKEIVNIIGNAELSNKCHSDCFINTDFDNECSLCRAATALYNAGYRKQSETAREIYNKIYDNLPKVCDWRWLQGALWAMQIAAEFVEVEK